MNGFLWGLLTIGIFALFLTISTMIGKITSKNAPPAAPMPMLDQLPTVMQRTSFLAHWNEALTMQRLNLSASGFTESLADLLRKQWDVQEKARITRKFTCQFKELKEREFTQPFTNNESLYSITETIPMVCKEIITDQTTGKKIQKRRFAGEIYATYSKEEYPDGSTVWKLHDVKIQKTNRRNLIHKIGQKLLVFAMFAPLITAFLANKHVVFMAITVGYNVIILLMTLIMIITAISSSIKSKKIKKVVPLEHMELYVANANHLVRELTLAKDLSPEGAAQYLSPQAHDSFLKEYWHKDSYVLQCYPYFNEYSPKETFEKDQKIYVKLQGSAYFRFLTKDRVMDEVTKDFALLITTKQPAIRQISGNYQIADLNNATFIEWGGDIYGTY